MRIFGIKISFQRSRKWALSDDVRVLSEQVQALQERLEGLEVSVSNGFEAIRKKVYRTEKAEEARSGGNGEGLSVTAAPPSVFRTGDNPSPQFMT